MAEETNKPTTSGSLDGVQIKPASPLRGLFPLIAIVVCAIVGHAIFYWGLGSPKNLEDGLKAHMDYTDHARTEEIFKERS